MKQIELSQGKVSRVDDDHYTFLSRYSWSISGGTKEKPYAGRRVDGITVYMHRVVAAWMAGRQLFDGEEVDHIDGDSLNNQSGNLRIVDRVENQRNQKHHSDSTSPYIGVYYNPRYKLPYTVKITVDYKNVHLGRFRTADEAAEHRDKAVLKLFGHHVQLNFPEKRNEYLADIKNGFDPFPPKRKYSSKYPGISYQAGIKKWKATAYTKGSQIHIGIYDTEDKAVEARSEYLKEHDIKDKCRVRK